MLRSIPVRLIGLIGLLSIPVPLIGLIGLLLTVDGIVAWLAGAPMWGWGTQWALGTGVLLGAFLARVGRRPAVAVGAGVVLTVLLMVLILVQGEKMTGIRLDDIPTILSFLVIFVVEVGIGIASILTGRASAQGANLWVYGVAGIAVIILVNYLAARHVRSTFDITAAKLESLSDQTETKLHALAEDVHVLAFYRDNDPERTYYADMLKKYEVASDRFSFEFVDPDKYPDVAQREDVNPRQTTIVVKSGDRREVVGGPEEKDLTNAIIKVTRPGVKKFYFSTWHGERPLEPDLSALTRALRELNYDVDTFRLTDGEIPPDCSVFVIAGPRAPFVPLEVERLERYLAQGKNLLVLLDPDSVATGLEDMLARYGASVQPNIIIERQRGLIPYGGGFYPGEQQYVYVRTTRYSEHAIVADLGNYGHSTGFYQAREVRYVRPDTVLKATGEAFIFAGTRMAFGEPEVRLVLSNPRATRSAEGKPSGPFPVAVAVTADATDPLAMPEVKAQLVVFGDVDFATDRGIGQERGNGGLILNSFTWLSEDKDLIAIRPREPGSKPVQLTASQGTFLFLLSVWRYPAVIFVVGLLIWWYRRSRGPQSQAT